MLTYQQALELQDQRLQRVLDREMAIIRKCEARIEKAKAAIEAAKARHAEDRKLGQLG